MVKGEYWIYSTEHGQTIQARCEGKVSLLIDWYSTETNTPLTRYIWENLYDMLISRCILIGSFSLVLANDLLEDRRIDGVTLCSLLHIKHTDSMLKYV